MKYFNEQDLIVFDNILSMVIDTDKEIDKEEKDYLTNLLYKVQDNIEFIRENGLEELREPQIKRL